MRIAFVIPTLNEQENIRPLIATLKKLPYESFFVIVDDRSEDGTAVILDELATGDSRVIPIHRTGVRSFAQSYIEGFKRALLLNPDVVVQMDADFSHDPNVVPNLVDPLERFDVVIGSRYIAGGDITGWNKVRLFVSRIANWFVRRVLPIAVRDLTSGFKAYRAAALRSMFFENIQSDKYGFQVETLWEFYRRGCRLKEVPITFAQRKEGQSKFHLGTIVEAFVMIFVLRFRRPPTIVPKNDEQFNDRVKEFYRQEEDYDWHDVAVGWRPEAIFHRLREKMVLTAVRQFGRPPFLDIGCGTGLVLQHLPPGSVGVDINERALARAAQHVPGATLLCQDVEALSFPAASFATIVCTEVLEHLVHPERTIATVALLLQSDGVFIASVPRQSFLWRLRWLSTTCPRIEPFHCEFKKRELVALFGPHFSSVTIKPRLFRSSFLIIARHHA